MNTSKLVQTAINLKLNKLPGVKPLYYRLWHEPALRLFNDVAIDVSTACNMNCVYCLHQTKHLVKPEFMTMDVFKKILEILSQEKFKTLHLYLSGEPFLNPNINLMIRAAAEKHMNVVIATKLNAPIKWFDYTGNYDGLMQSIFACAWNKVTIKFIITLDSLVHPEAIAPGAGKELIKHNFEKLAEFHDYPPMRWQLATVVNKANEHELDNIRTYLEKLHLARFWQPYPMAYYMPGYGTKEDIRRVSEYLPDNPEYRSRCNIVDEKVVSLTDKCNYLNPALGPTGDVTICCHDMLHLIKVGNILESGSLRNIIADKWCRITVAHGRKMMLQICQGCN